MTDGRVGGHVARRRLTAVVVLLFAAVAGSMTAPLPARAQPAADTFIGCFSIVPGGKMWFRIDRRGGQIGYDMGDGKRSPLVPAPRGDLDWAADELELERFPGSTIAAGLSEKAGDVVFVVLSSPLSWHGRATPFAAINTDFGAEPMFRMNCP